MKYYLVAGEASGDLHASRLMRALRSVDARAEFRFYGGDLMKAEGGECVCHYRDIAYMGFMPVVTHLSTILRARKECKKDIIEWKPDVVILVDYADFNLNVAKFIKTTDGFVGPRPLVFFYISPKIWAWKEWRIRDFRRYVDKMYCILPFEVDFYEGKHNYPVDYVGNPTAEEVRDFQRNYKESEEAFKKRHGLDERPVVALLAGSRWQEVKDNLPMMVSVARKYEGYQFVVAGVTTVAEDLYDKHLTGTGVKRVTGETYALLSHSVAAVVTSGTATLETCCMGVPQVVVYKTVLPRVVRFVWNHFFGVGYISLVNLIAGKEVVAEMFAERFTYEAICEEFEKVLPSGSGREDMMRGYELVMERLGSKVAATETAQSIIESV